MTRPREDADGISAALEARGFSVQIEPLLEIHIRTGQRLPVDGLQGILATSANGVRALAANLTRRDLPVWAVGDATARCARALGFDRVESAGGNVESLAALVAEHLDPAEGELLHAAGSTLAGDLSGRLTARGFVIRRQVLYEAQPAEALSPTLALALADGSLDLALFFSPRTAACFATLARAAGQTENCSRISAYALSPAVTAALAVLPWRSIRTAARPEQESLLTAIDDGEKP